MTSRHYGAVPERLAGARKQSDLQTGQTELSMVLQGGTLGASGYRKSSLTAKLLRWFRSCLRKQTPALRCPADHKVTLKIYPDEAVVSCRCFGVFDVQQEFFLVFESVECVKDQTV